MPLQIIRQDITKMTVDAIVNAANSSLLGGGGVDGCIHRAAGIELLEECKTLGGCNTGDAKITRAYKLPCKYVIHAVGPRYIDGKHDEEVLLRSCYEKSLNLAKENECESVAFPLISSGIYGYPKAEALKVAIDTISSFLLENDMTVYIVIFDKNAYKISEKLFADIEEFVDDNYVDEHFCMYPESRRMNEPYYAEEKCMSIEMGVGSALFDDLEEDLSLKDVIDQIDESFSEMLLRKIDEKGIKDSECYKKANIDRKLFSKIRSDVHYKPSKPTVIAFAIALELSLDETRDMLMKAGFALSHSSKFDLPSTINIVAGNNIDCFFVVNVTLKHKDFDEKSIIAISKLISQNLLFALECEDEICLAIYHLKLIKSEWQPKETVKIELKGLDLDSVWENIIKQIGDIQVAQGKTLDEQIAIDDKKAKLEKEIARLEKQARNEKQPKKKFELVQCINNFKQELSSLS